MAQPENGQVDKIEGVTLGAPEAGGLVAVTGLWTPEVQERLDTDLRKVGKPPGDVDIGTRVLRPLMREGAVTVRDALVIGSKFMRAILNVGPKTVDQAQEELGQFMPEIPFVDDPKPDFVATFCPALSQVTWLALGKSWSDGLKIFVTDEHPRTPSVQDILDRPIEEIIDGRIYYYPEHVDREEFQIGVREAAAEYAEHYYRALGGLGVTGQPEI